MPTTQTITLQRYCYHNDEASNCHPTKHCPLFVIDGSRDLRQIEFKYRRRPAPLPAPAGRWCKDSITQIIRQQNSNIYDRCDKAQRYTGLAITIPSVSRYLRTWRRHRRPIKEVTFYFAFPGEILSIQFGFRKQNLTR